MYHIKNLYKILQFLPDLKTASQSSHAVVVTVVKIGVKFFVTVFWNIRFKLLLGIFI